MKLFNSYFLSIDCEVDLHGEVGGAPSMSGGFLLIDNHLVPDAFVDRLAKYFASRGFLYGPVITPRELVGDEFWKTLGKNERRVLGPCLLMLIELGYIEVSFMDEPN